MTNPSEELPASGNTSLPASELLRAALSASEAASQVAQSFWERRSVDEWFKPDGSRVTRADLAVEESIRHRLDVLTPGVSVLAEETAPDGAGHRGHDWPVGDPGSDGWVVDPIDGTENFSRGNPLWATMIAFRSAGRTTVSVISAPAMGHLWTAVRGRGAFASNRRIRVSQRGRADGTFCYGGLHECPSAHARLRLLEVASAFRCAWGWGNFWGHVQVAQGSAEAALSYGVELWDVAAPALLVEEAGGTWSDVEGEPDLLSGTLLTSSGQLHNDLVSDLSTSRTVRPADSPPRIPGDSDAATFDVVAPETEGEQRAR